jgi:hypothetical protein
VRGGYEGEERAREGGRPTEVSIKRREEREERGAYKHTTQYATGHVGYSV